MLDVVFALTAQFSFSDFVVRSTLPLVLAALFSLALRKRSAAIRHRVWLLGLAASLVVPVVTPFLPKLRIPLFPSPIEVSKLAQGPSGQLSIAHRLRPAYRTEDARGVDAPQSTGLAASLASEKSKTLETPTRISVARRFEEVLVLFWLTGVFLGAIVFLWCALLQITRLRRLRPTEDEHWEAAVARAAQQIGLSCSPNTVVSDRQCVPSTTGVFRPLLVVPRHWRQWPPEQRDCILLHELAHVRRRDVASQCFARVALLVHWFNPLVWWGARRMRVERELASDDCVLQAGHAPSNYAEQLLATLREYHAVPTAIGIAMASSGRLDERVRAILDPDKKREPVSRFFSFVAVLGVVCISVIVGGITPVANAIAQADMGNPPPSAPVWKESYTVRYEKSLPVSVAFDIQGKTLLTSDTNGELMNLNLVGNEATYNWKSDVGGSHPAVAYALDGKSLYATTTDGVRILDARNGEEIGIVEEKNSRPTAVGVFPIKSLGEDVSWTQVVFGNARGYFVKTWVSGKPALAGTIQTSTVADGQEVSDHLAVPLAVDPEGRSAIMTGPLAGAVGGLSPTNVLWAYVCGDYDDGTPGNRLMEGHTARVVSAAWSKGGSVAVTGDDSGRIIEWNTVTMKESRRRELGGRVAALAVSKNGERVAAYVLGQRARVVVWEVGDAKMHSIHREIVDLTAATAYASLEFSPDGNQLAGCTGDHEWLKEPNQPIGKVRIWELATTPGLQPAPKLEYSKPISRRSSFVIPNNHSIVRVVAQEGKQGYVDFMRVDDGQIQSRLGLSKSPLGRMVLSADHEWMAIEQELSESGDGERQSYNVMVRNASVYPSRSTVSNCQQLLDLSQRGEWVAVVRDGAVEIWDTTKAERIQRAPFEHSKLDVARFSPDGELLAISDRNTLVLWKWRGGEHKRINLEREVCSLAFSPDGRFLAEGPGADLDIRIRDVESNRVVRSLSNDQPLSIPELKYTQGGRVLIACNRVQLKGEGRSRARLLMWDMADGSLAHQVEVDGPVSAFAVSPNEHFLVAQVEGPTGKRLDGWRLDGGHASRGNDFAAPASTSLDDTAAKDKSTD